MLVFLRVAGTVNAGVWLGSSVAIFFLAEPLFLAPETLMRVDRWTAGAALMDRWHALQYVCASLALLQIFVEWLYAGRSPRRFALYLVLGLLGAALLGDQLVSARLKELHLDIFGVRSTPAQREQGRKWFAAWAVSSRVLHGFLCAGLVILISEITVPNGAARVAGWGKFRG